jgi:hypothetical protein
MRQFSASLCVAAALLVGSPRAEAGIDWSYIGDTEVTISSGGSILKFVGTIGAATNSTGVILFNLTATSGTSADDAPDHFDKSPFTLNVSVIDEKARISKKGNELGTLTYKGFFTADVTKGSLTDWSVEWDVDQGSVVLGNGSVGLRKYDLKIDGFLPPSPNNPALNGQGSIHANALVTTVGDASGQPETFSDTPEPSSLLLAGLAVGGAGIAWRRRRVRMAA